MLKDLKLPKPKKTDSEPKPISMDQAQYPHQLSITLEGKTLEKFPDMIDAKSGQEFGMNAVVRVKVVKKVDKETSEDHWEQSSVQLQIIKADFDQDKQLDEAFDED